MGRSIASGCSILVSLLLVSAASARPPYKQALSRHFGTFLARKLIDCRTCHLVEEGKTAEDEKPHNSFGARLAAVRRDLRAAGKKTTIEARLDAVLNEDSDGDGHTNLDELLAGRFPGEADDRPSAEELRELARTTRTAFERFHKGYPWRPYEPVARPAVPKVKDVAWVRNPIDAFIAAEQEAQGLRPGPEAPREILFRRVHLDLIGLPPTAAEVEAFLGDDAPDAYEKAVERLLATPQYAERWARHWMDVWRYSDWAGYGAQIRDSQPHIWRWRDWIVASLHQDRGYDRMILEMLAGDELAPEDERALTGTGYLVRNYKLLSREKWMQDAVEHTSMAFLGLTMGCARCHDHMFDPVSQEDYYRFRAFFEPHKVRIDRVPGQPDTKVDGLARVFDADSVAPTYLFLRGDDRTPDKSRTIEPGVPDSLGGTFPKIEPVPLSRSAAVPDKRSFVIEETLRSSAENLHKAAADLAAKRFGAVLALLDPSPGTGWRVPSHHAAGLAADVAGIEQRLAEANHRALEAVLQAEKLEDGGRRKEPEYERIARRAQAAQREAALLLARKNLSQAEKSLQTVGSDAKKRAAAEKVHAAAAKAWAQADAATKQPLTGAFTPRKLTAYPATSTGRRLALARWIASRDNPRTARVAVNQLWMRHFGQGLVPSMFDFGNNGRPPTHPALLDWLAAEFMEPTLRTGGTAPAPWTMKHLHLLMVTSATYRQTSTPNETARKIDPDNRFLWRFQPRRAEAEVVRDSVFHVAGKLDLARGGPDIDYPLGLKVPRRSLYFRHAAEKQMEFLLLFDVASVTECYERKHSIIPQQALALFNSDLALRHARLLARDLAKQSTSEDPGAYVAAAFRQVLSRRPSPAETEACVLFLQDRTTAYRKHRPAGPSNDAGDGHHPAADPLLRARENLVHVLMNHHDFVTIR